jgi:hypothetical protein
MTTAIDWAHQVLLEPQTSLVQPRSATNPFRLHSNPNIRYPRWQNTPWNYHHFMQNLILHLTQPIRNPTQV